MNLLLNDAWVQFEEVEVGDLGVLQVAKERGNIDLAGPVEIEQRCKLVIHGIADLDASAVIKLVLEVGDCQLAV